MTTYSIHLDDLDVALLPIEGRSCNNFLKKELFEFQLLAKEAEDPPVYTNHPCHICAIDVPAEFWSAHCAGAKHRANTRIATSVTKRMSALITATPPPHTPLTCEQFCDSCTCIAGKDHEKTQEHKLSVFQDKMLCDLVLIYTGDDVNNDQKENEKKNLSPRVENGATLNQNKTQNISNNISEDKSIVPRYNELIFENDEVVKNNNITTKQTNVNPKDTASKSLQTQEHKLFDFDRTLSDDVNNDQKEKKKKKKKKDSKYAMNQEHSMRVNKDVVGLNLVKLNADQTPRVTNATNISNQNKTQNISGEISEAKNIVRSYAQVMSNKNEKNKTMNTATKPTKLNPQDVSEQINGLDVKDHSIDENAIHYPFVKELLEVRCLVCDCIVPAHLHNRVTHCMGRRHVANLNDMD